MTPTCSSCSSVSCQCVRSWKKHFKDASIEPVDDDLITNGLEGPDDALREDAHYLDTEAQYGHNETKIKFPLPTCPIQKSVLDKQQNGTYGLPSVMIPKWSIIVKQMQNSPNDRSAKHSCALLTLHLRHRAEQYIPLQTTNIC